MPHWPNICLPGTSVDIYKEDYIEKSRKYKWGLGIGITNRDRIVDNSGISVSNKRSDNLGTSIANKRVDNPNISTAGGKANNSDINIAN